MEIREADAQKNCVTIESCDISYSEPGSKKAFIAVMEVDEEIGVFVAIGTNQDAVKRDLQSTGKILHVLPLLDTLWKAKYLLDNPNASK